MAAAVVGGADAFLLFFLWSLCACVEEVGVLFFRLMGDGVPEAPVPFEDAGAVAAPATGTVFTKFRCDEEYIKNKSIYAGYL